jgi:choline dehydrogenase-like flavoprotein
MSLRRGRQAARSVVLKNVPGCARRSIILSTAPGAEGGAMSEGHYDAIIIGSGPGGGSVAWRLAKTGKRILLLERGGYLPRERENWDSQAVFVDARYQAPEVWYDSNGRSFHPGLHYYVGGNSKVYGGVLLRLRERDFEEVRHPDGISPAWPVKYDVFEPYYQAAEELFHVHGLRGEDPTEPPSR